MQTRVTEKEVYERFPDFDFDPGEKHEKHFYLSLPEQAQQGLVPLVYYYDEVGLSDLCKAIRDFHSTAERAKSSKSDPVPLTDAQ